jgi:hypothetical protein
MPVNSRLPGGRPSRRAKNQQRRRRRAPGRRRPRGTAQIAPVEAADRLERGDANVRASPYSAAGQGVIPKNAPRVIPLRQALFEIKG